VREHNLSVRQTEELVRRALAQPDKQSIKGASNVKHQPSSVVRPPSSHSIEEDLRRALGTKVELYHSQRGGKIIIEFYSDEELDAIYQKIVH
jgi:ParB family chromosome partitioning protein